MNERIRQIESQIDWAIRIGALEPWYRKTLEYKAMIAKLKGGQPDTYSRKGGQIDTLIGGRVTPKRGGKLTPKHIQ